MASSIVRVWRRWHSTMPRPSRTWKAIVHPEVRRMVDGALEDAGRDDAPFVAIEAIKLVEGGLADRCDEVWLIECDHADSTRAPTGPRSGAEDADLRIAAQGGGLVDETRAGARWSSGGRTARPPAVHRRIARGNARANGRRSRGGLRVGYAAGLVTRRHQVDRAAADAHLPCRQVGRIRRRAAAHRVADLPPAALGRDRIRRWMRRGIVVRPAESRSSASSRCRGSSRRCSS